MKLILNDYGLRETMPIINKARNVYRVLTKGIEALEYRQKELIESYTGWKSHNNPERMAIIDYMKKQIPKIKKDYQTVIDFAKKKASEIESRMKSGKDSDFDWLKNNLDKIEKDFTQMTSLDRLNYTMEQQELLRKMYKLQQEEDRKKK